MGNITKFKKNIMIFVFAYPCANYLMKLGGLKSLYITEFVIYCNPKANTGQLLEKIMLSHLLCSLCSLERLFSSFSNNEWDSDRDKTNAGLQYSKLVQNKGPFTLFFPQLPTLGFDETSNIWLRPFSALINRMFQVEYV